MTVSHRFPKETPPSLRQAAMSLPSSGIGVIRIDSCSIYLFSFSLRSLLPRIFSLLLRFFVETATSFAVWIH